jgi:hypothetical protein
MICTSSRLLNASRLGLVIVLFTAVSHVEAGMFIATFTGTTEMSEDGDFDGMVSFSVYEVSAGDTDWTDDFFVGFMANSITGSGSVDTDARYVYFYQVVNNNPVDTGIDIPLDGYSVLSGVDAYTSGGYLSNTTDPLVFNDSAGAINATTNPSIGSPPPSGDNTTTFGSLVSPFFVADSAARVPMSVSLGGGSLTATANFTWPSVVGGRINSGQVSPVLFLTSDLPPAFGPGTIRFGSGMSNSLVPVHNPEPGTVALWLGLGAIGIVAFSRRKRIE